MALAYRSLLYGPIYTLKGVPAQVTTRSGRTVSVTAIDKTAGVELPGPVGVETMRPAAKVRAGELLDLAVDPDDLADGTIALNGASWRINATRSLPTANGQSDGQIYLLLEGTAG